MKYIFLILCFSVALISYSCTEKRDCEAVTQFILLDTLDMSIKDTVITTYDHAIVFDTLYPGFMKIDSTEVPSEENPDSTYIKYDTTVFDASISFVIFNDTYNLRDSLVMLAGDSVEFGNSDIKRVFFLMWQIPKVKLVTKLNQMQISKSN